MGLTDTLKKILSPAPKIIEGDGKSYTFIPGKYGSLTAPATKPSPIEKNERPPAKVVPINVGS